MQQNERLLFFVCSGYFIGVKFRCFACKPLNSLFPPECGCFLSPPPPLFLHSSFQVSVKWPLSKHPHCAQGCLQVICLKPQFHNLFVIFVGKYNEGAIIPRGGGRWTRYSLPFFSTPEVISSQSREMCFGSDIPDDIVCTSRLAAAVQRPTFPPLCPRQGIQGGS